MKLTQPGRIGAMETRNRVVMAAMGIRGTTDDDGDWGERTRAFYSARAAGGTGTIIPEMVFVSRAPEPSASTCIDLASDRHLESVQRLADSLHQYDSKHCTQLTGGFGRVVPPYLSPEWWTDDPLPAEHQPISASVNNNHFGQFHRNQKNRCLRIARVNDCDAVHPYSNER